MKKLLLSLMVLATLMSCGKDNKVSSGSVSNGYSNGYLSGNPNASAAAQALAAAINNPSAFGQGIAYTSTGSNQTCGTKWGFINYCYGSTSSGAVTTGETWNQIIARAPSVVFQYTNGNVRNGSDVTVASQQTFIMDLLNKATNVQVYGTIYYITVGSDIWAVDLRYALQMNPSAKQTNGYTAYYFLRAI